MTRRYGVPAKPVPERFWPKVSKTDGGCWLWAGSKNNKGYGVLGIKDTPTLAHRISWEIHNGPIPAGLCALHNCPGGDNPACVNPDHLWLGTHAENMRDAKAKGRIGSITHPERIQRGSQRSAAKLVEADAVAIRTALAAGRTAASLASDYHVTSTTIQGIRSGRSWAHAGGPTMYPKGGTGMRNGSKTHPERVARGERNGKARLTDADVLAIRAALATGAKQKALARQYGLDPSTISDIHRRKRWKHV